MKEEVAFCLYLCVVVSTKCLSWWIVRPSMHSRFDFHQSCWSVKTRAFVHIILAHNLTPTKNVRLSKYLSASSDEMTHSQLLKQENVAVITCGYVHIGT